MSQRFNKAKYGQRWQVETVNSMIKRRQGSALGAASYWSQCREMCLRAIVHNVMILWHQGTGFLRSIPDTVSGPKGSLRCWPQEPLMTLWDA
jgi:hypothetical protein